MMKGWSLNKARPLDMHSIPMKKKMVCLRKPFLKRTSHKELTAEERYYSYEPEPLDLTKVEIKVDLLVSDWGAVSWTRSVMLRIIEQKMENLFLHCYRIVMMSFFFPSQGSG